MAYQNGHVKGEDPDVTQIYGSRTASDCCAYLIPYLKPNYSILDAGCGPGSITAGLASICPEGKVVGIDTAGGVIAQASALYKAPNLSFEVGDAMQLSQFPDASFDIIHAHMCVLHCTDPVKAMKAFYRVCKPGGIVATRDPMRMDPIFALKPEIPAIRELQYITVKWLKSMGSNPEAGLYKEDWARQAGFGKDGGRIILTESPQFHKTGMNTMSGEGAQYVIKAGIATEEDVKRMNKAWDEWERAEGHEVATIEADMLCFKGT